ncbi:MAG: TRAP transporter large permease subunit [Bryobacterales bacterium]
MPSAEQTSTAARIENAVSIAVLAAMSVLPIIEIVGRVTVGHGIPGSIPLVQNLTLWVAILGAALAARADRLLALTTRAFLPQKLGKPIAIFTAAIAAAVTGTLCAASVDLVRIERGSGDTVAWGIPVWVVLAVMPAGFALITGRILWHASSNAAGRALAALGLVVPLAFGLFPGIEETGFLWPSMLVLLAATALGMPIFTAIGGAALLLFLGDGTPVNAVPGETYRLASSPLLPAIPLFALGGYILAEGGASQRLTRLFSALFGAMPGGLAIVTALVLAVFTPLTGASGVTIVSIGGLLLPVLTQAGYPERSSVGLVTVSGSIGLLLPPSLPVFIYGYYANQPFEQLFLGGLIPGLLLIAVVAGWGAWIGWKSGAKRTPFDGREALAASWQSKWDLLLPVVVLGGIFGGFATLVEAAALTVLYAFVVECFVYRSLSITNGLGKAVVDCATLLGGFMIILAVALGFTNFLILTEVPTQALEWVQTHIESKLLFLLALNVLLLIVGALMDIYSALIVIVPLIIPMAEAYEIDPIHLGIIFLANLELGYLTPPMGANLFLSSYRFDKPLTEVFRSVLPYLVILLIAVLLITYVPAMTLWFRPGGP